MTRTFGATFDGEVFRPDEPVPLAPHTRVRMTIEDDPATMESAVSFFEIAADLNLDGPPDWSSRLDDYLYSEREERGD